MAASPHARHVSKPTAALKGIASLESATSYSRKRSRVKSTLARAWRGSAPLVARLHAIQGSKFVESSLDGTCRQSGSFAFLRWTMASSAIADWARLAAVNQLNGISEVFSGP